MKQIVFYISLILLYNQSIAQDFWMPLSKPTNASIYSLAIDTENNIFAGMGTSNGVYYSNNNGQTWVQIGLENLSTYSLLSHSNGTVLAGTGGFNSLYRMENLESGWIPLIAGLGNVISIMACSNGDLFIGNWGEIYKSTDNGGNWTQVLILDNNQVINSIVESTDGVLFAGVTAYFGGGGVYRSLNGGNTWEYVGLLNNYISSLAINSQGVLFAGSRGENIGIFRSFDNGDTWEQLKYDVHVTSILVTPDDAIYAACTHEHGLQGGVYKSVDNGDTWVLTNTGLTNFYVEMLEPSPNGYLYVGARNEYGHPLFRSTNPIFTGIIPSTNENETFQVYPNPFSQYINITIPQNMLYAQRVAIDISNTLGEQVWQSTLPMQQKLTVNPSVLKPGIYILTARINQKHVSTRIVKL